MKWVRIFQVGILLEFSEWGSPGGGSLMGRNFPGSRFPGGISLEPWIICIKAVKTFVFVSRTVAL